MLSKENALIEFGILTQLKLQSIQLRKLLFSMQKKAEILEEGPFKDFMCSLRNFCIPNHIEVHLKREISAMKKIIG